MEKSTKSAVAALALIWALGPSANAQRSEANAILEAIVANAQAIGRVCTSRPRYFCTVLESASLNAGKLKMTRSFRAPSNVSFHSMEIDLRSVTAATERHSGPVALIVKIHCREGMCMDGGRSNDFVIAISPEENTRAADEIIRLFDRLSAICCRSRC